MTPYPQPSAMTADLHAGAPHVADRAYFFLTGTTSTDLLPRVLNPFLRLGLTPYRIHASSEHGTGEEMAVELRFTGLPAQLAESLAARCRAVIGVRSVLTVTED